MGIAETPAAPNSSPTSSKSGDAPRSFLEMFDQASPIFAENGGLPAGISPAAQQDVAPASFSAASSASRLSARQPDFNLPNAKPDKVENRDDASKQTAASSDKALEQVLPNVVALSMPPLAPEAAPGRGMAEAGKATGKTETDNLTASSSVVAAHDCATGPALREEAASPTASALDSQLSQHASKAAKSSPLTFGPPKAASSDAGLADAEPAGFLDRQTNDGQPQRVVLSQPLESAPDSQAKAVSPTEIQSPPRPAFNWESAMQKIAPGSPGAKSNYANLNSTNSKNVDPHGSYVHGSDDKVADPARVNLNQATPKSANLYGDNLKSADFKNTDSRKIDSRTPDSSGTYLTSADSDDQGATSPVKVTPDAAQAVSTLVAGQVASRASDAKVPPASTWIPLHDGSPETNGSDNRTPLAVKPEGDQDVLKLTGVPAPLVPPLIPTAVMSAGASPVSATRLVSDSSRVSAMQTRVKPETTGTNGKSTDTSANSRIEPREENSGHTSDAQAADQSNGSVPAKGAEQSSPAAAAQLISTDGESKNGNAAFSPASANPQSGQLEHESTGVASNQVRPDIPAAYPTSLINSAKLVERIGEAELRLGMRAGEFGNVDIRTSMVRNQFTAEISVERGELGRVMAADLPGLQTRLAEQRVPVANITVQNHAGSTSTAAEQQKPRDGQQAYATSGGRGINEDWIPATAALEGIGLPSARLDIHM
jgi:flagellar hook-length control protein FliK